MSYDYTYDDSASDIESLLLPRDRHCVLAAGDAGDFCSLQTWLDGLEPNAYGKVFIEVFSPIQYVEFNAPEGVSITWLYRERMSLSPRPGVGRPRCAALVEAVDAWLSEWLRGDECDVPHICVWAGARSSSIMNRYWQKLARELQAGNGDSR